MKEFKVIFKPKFDPPVSANYIEYFNTNDEVCAAFNTIAGYTLFLHEERLMDDYSNIGGAYQLVDGDWLEIEVEFR